jgi:hypothetical protein
MVDNVAITPGTGATVAADDIAGVLHQRVKISQGADGSATDVSSAAPLQVTLANTGANATPVVVDLGANNDVTVTGTVTVDLSTNNDVTVTSGSITATQATGSNLHTVVDSGTITTVSTVTSVTAIGTSVTPGTSAAHLGKAIDSPAGATDTGVAVLAVRDDTLSALTPAETDYVPLRVNSTGALHVTGGGGGTQYNVDVAAGGSDTGTMALAVRDDVLSTLTPVDGDYAPMRVDSTGRLYVTAPDVVAALSGGSLVDDAAFTVGADRVSPIGLLADEVSTDSVTEDDIGVPRMTLDRKAIVTPQPHTSGGLPLPVRKIDLDETPVAVKASAGQLYGYHVSNRTTSPLYLRFYNIAAGSVTVGTSTIAIGPLEIPANASDHTVMLQSFGGHGIAFDTAISMAMTTGFADNDTAAPAANASMINVFYK